MIELKTKPSSSLRSNKISYRNEMNEIEQMASELGLTNKSH